MNEEEFRVSKSMLKTISAETRTDILKALENRPMTASELSRYLKKHVTTVSEHLDMLKDYGLVERIERPGRKWIYYKLTGGGNKILHPRNYRVVFVLSTIFLIFLSGTFLYNVDALPGDIFYPIKLGREKIQLVFSKNDLSRAEKHLEFSEKRLIEAKELSRQGKHDEATKVLRTYKQELNQAGVEVKRAEIKKADVIPTLEKFKEKTTEHETILENILVVRPELKNEIREAKQVSRESRMSATADLEKITGKPYNITD